MPRSRALCALAVAVTALIPGSAHAVVIDFESLAQPGFGIFTVGDSYSEDGFTISQFPAPQDLELKYFGQGDPRFPGSTALFNDTVGGGIRLAPTGGGTFSITSIDLANLLFGGQVSVTFVGTHPDLTTVTQTFTFDSFGSLATFAFDDFSNLITLDWAQGEVLPFHQFDNLVVTTAAVPEPSSLALLGGALLAVAWRARRARPRR